MEWNNKVVLVTGGTGSFGKKLIKILVEEYQPAFYGRESADVVKVQVAAASLRTKARQAQPTVWVNKQMKRSKFVEGLNLGKE